MDVPERIWLTDEECANYSKPLDQWALPPSKAGIRVTEYVRADAQPQPSVPEDVVARIESTLTSLAYCAPECRVGLVYEKLLWPYLWQINELTKRLDGLGAEQYDSEVCAYHAETGDWPLADAQSIDLDEHD